MAVTKEEVIDFIANMTVLQLSEFIKELEEKFGVSAAAPMMAMAAMPAASMLSRFKPSLLISCCSISPPLFPDPTPPPCEKRRASACD